MGVAAIADLSPLMVLGVTMALLLKRVIARTDLGHQVLRLVGAGMFSLAVGLLGVMAHLIAAALPADATDPGNPCGSGQTPRTFNVSLINIPIFLNRFGDVIPEGRMYVLDQNIDAVRASFTHAADPAMADQTDLVEPLTLRVNKGDCVEVNFTNRLFEAAPAYERNDSIFPLPGETVQRLTPGAATPQPRTYAPAASTPHNEFNNARPPHASMHFEGLDYDVTGSDGTYVGDNPDSTAPPNQTVTYRLHANTEGEFQFKDGADFSSQDVRPTGTISGSQTFGAFGSIIVEPSGATWVDARTGGALASGTRAIIKQPGAPDYREYVLYMHDEIQAEPGILTRFCPPKGAGDDDDEGDTLSCVPPTAAQQQKLQAGTLPGLGGGDANALINGEVPVKLEWLGFNYRSEPEFNREEVGCPAATKAAQGYDAEACVGEETGLSSWVYGDPGGGDLVYPSYRGEPTQLRLMHAAEQETHTFHWHVNRWALDPADEGGIGPISNPNNWTAVSNPLDVQAISPGTSYDLIPEGGAGSAYLDKPATFGDIIFHCHLYPHFAAGMWGLNRTFDTLQDGSGTNPDGTPVPALQPLEDYDYQAAVSGTNAPPAPTSTKPGFPSFLPGQFGYKAPKPPMAVPERQTNGAFPPTELEKAAADPGAQVAGGFFQDPCPTGRPTKTFDVAAIQIDQKYNDDLNWHNPQARVYVLQEDKAAVLAGKKPEPFAPILNVGDCVVYHLTNELPRQYGGTVFDRAQVTNEVGIHQHMVLFDVLSSDGAANGWNYDEGADTNQTFTYRDFVQDNTSTNSFHDHFFANVHQKAGMFGGASIQPAGCTPRLPGSGDATAPPKVGTVFDVVCTPTTDYRGRQTDGQDYRNFSLFVEDHVAMFQPDNPNTTTDDQFVTPNGVPIFPAKFPSSEDDQGVMGVNYRLEPFEARRNGDPANLFDSSVWGDPFTPLLRANAGDHVKIRLFQLSQEESHGFNLDRFRWKSEPRDPDSTVVQAQHIGVLEYFDLDVPIDDLLSDTAGEAQFRDYMWYYGGADDWFLGTWGLMRVAGCSDPPGEWGLRPLPDNDHACPALPKRGTPGAGSPPDPGNPCPTGAPTKQFAVSAINKDITYNSHGDHDPYGLMYALTADVPALRAGTKTPEPLIIRGNAGDCVEVTLSNELDPTLMKPNCFESLEPGQIGYRDTISGAWTYPSCVDTAPRSEMNVPGFQPFPVSTRVSMRPQLVDHHEFSAGTNVGFNVDSTVAPGESITYRWYLPPNVSGMATLEDRADVQNHLHHGLYGALIIEPAGSSYLDPNTGAPLASGQQAVVVNASQPDFRENIALLNSDLALFRKDTNNNPFDDLPVPDNTGLDVAQGPAADDPEDQGEFSVNYSNEPWSWRYAEDPTLSDIFSSTVHGDPSTPLFRAYSGDNTWFRVGQAVGDPRSTSFALHDHTWRRAPDDPQSNIVASQGLFNPGVVYNVHLDPSVTGGAGGPRGAAGDFLYRSGTLPRHLMGGQWGIFRVHASGQSDLIALSDHPVTGAPTAQVPALGGMTTPAAIPRNAV